MGCDRRTCCTQLLAQISVTCDHHTAAVDRQPLAYPQTVNPHVALAADGLPLPPCTQGLSRILHHTGSHTFSNGCRGSEIGHPPAKMGGTDRQSVFAAHCRETLQTQ